MGDPYGMYQPLAFACTKCRKEPSFFERRGSSYGRRVELTGRSRVQRSKGKNFRRWPDEALEYKCPCGHVGWSRHPDVHRLKRRQEKQNAER